MSKSSAPENTRRCAESIFRLSRYIDPIDRFRALGTYATGLGLILAGILAVLTNLVERISTVNTAATQDNLATFLIILPHLFDRFYRGQDVGSSNIPGIGLGLALVKDIVDCHKGRIEVDSQIGKGSDFRVWLPL